MGFLERFHRRLKSLKCTLSSPTAWTDTLPLVLLGFRSAFVLIWQASVAEFVYGTTLRLPGDFLVPSAEQQRPEELTPTRPAQDFLAPRAKIAIFAPLFQNAIFLK